MAIAQIMNRLYKMYVLVIGTSYGAEKDPESENKNLEVREPGMAMNRGVKNPRKRPQC